MYRLNPQSHIVEIPGLLSNKISRRLIFADEGLTIEKKLGFKPLSFIAAEDISGIRMGVKWIKGLWFILGRQFIVELLLGDKRIVHIKLNSLYNLRAQSYEEAWALIINHLYAYYFSSQINLYIELFRIGQSFNIAGIDFYPDGICWDKKTVLYWNQISLSNYQTYFVVHHRQNARFNKSFNFLNDWNAHILQAMLKYAVEDHQRMFSE